MVYTDQFMGYVRKKHHHLSSNQSGGDDYPIIFSGGVKDKSEKKVYKIGHDLKIKEHPDVKEIKNDSEKDKILVAKSMNIGYYLITPLILGVFFGFWLDRVFKTKPILLLVFFAFGIVGSFYNLWKYVNETK
ncbi:AtpZ/AtpI family protein [Patescibacteria group bacterium]|nr:AtpZ/AtpI family protein [Patescibacteria group bacterium]